jgi:putative lipase involved disintegration of autophagic bodies
MSKRRTHAFIVSKGVLDEEFEPCLTSLLADRSVSSNVKQLLDTFDFGINKKSSNQERLGVIKKLDVPSARASEQQRLMESTNGLFHIEEQRQVELAQELAESRDRQADIAFKEWVKSKVKFYLRFMICLLMPLI